MQQHDALGDNSRQVDQASGRSISCQRNDWHSFFRIPVNIKSNSTSRAIGFSSRKRRGRFRQLIGLHMRLRRGFIDHCFFQSTYGLTGRSAIRSAA